MCIDRTLLCPLNMLWSDKMSAVTWSRWCPWPGLRGIPRVGAVAGVRPCLEVLQVPGVGVDEEELPDEGAVPALLLVQAVQADPARGVTHHQPQGLPDTAEMNFTLEKYSLTLRTLTLRGSRWSWPRSWWGAPWRRLSPGWMCPWPEQKWQNIE